ncbi:helix-turn-helix domain-containing protein [Sphingomonas sp. AR_OL41]|jgi:cytoskeletal protein RodZ|uniref:helix-turn-helix domain-containing protein n=1 Tax=Sphingomonas sp. AR_OL41 TaxID=3042729 RepID=UPI002480EF2F|nr:helix-turn-helix domain-containing protein [Sphingomonas sp. AR_OL41]MDH7973801.1 helix-turn-helix domain-containing protein [Sphingomonas sp. AR_OL41]
MTDPSAGEEATLFPKTAGEKLREAREAQGLSLAEIAARTRIPLRQLEAIENSEFAQLPSITYAVGFAKAYARAVGLDEVTIAREVRGINETTVRRTEYEAYEINDPSRVPSRGVAMFGAIIALLVLIGAGLWFGTNLFRGQENSPPPLVVPSDAPPPVAAAPTAPVTGQVTLTANDEVWLRVYEADGSPKGKTLFENTLKPGDHFEVPATAQNPMINVGRPDKLQVTVNGSVVPALGSGKVAIKDVPISAAALLARATPAPDATPTPAVSATSDRPAPRPTPRHTTTPRPVPTSVPALNIAAPAAPAPAKPVATATPTP